jgi:Protein of unknown function (DUF3352)
MRRRLIPALVPFLCAALLAVGCGGDESSGGPLESALEYVPRETPFTVAIDTDLEGDQYKSLESIAGRFPGGDSIKQQLQEQLEQGDEGVSFDADVKPLLGNPFVVSATDVTSFTSDSDDADFVAALQVEDTDALDALVDKTKPDERGEVAGATVYEDDGTFFAVEDDMVVFGGARDQLEAALERADGDDHLSAAEFQDSLEGLPREALARVSFDLQALLEQDPGAASARKVDWVSALRTVGITASAQGDSVDVEFNLRTDGEDLSDEDLPLAAGDEAPEVIKEPGEVVLGIRDPSQIVAFFERTFQTLDPAGSGEYEAGKRALAQRLDLDLDEDFVGQLTGDVSISVAADYSFAVRADVARPDAFAQTLEKLAGALPQLGSGLGVVDVSRRGDLYQARLADGSGFVFGMVDGAFVAASNAARAAKVGAGRPEAVDGASGSLVMTADAERFVGQVLEFYRQFGSGGALGGVLARPLDELNGSVSTSTDGMRGKFSLTLD